MTADAAPAKKSWTLENVKSALPALLAAGTDVMPMEERATLLMSAGAALLMGATKGSEGGLTPEVVADIELAGQACTELVRAYQAAQAPAADAAAAPGVEVESGQTPAGHTLIAAGKAEGLSDDDLRDAIHAALAERFPPAEKEGDSPWHIWVIDVFQTDSTVVYELNREKFQLGYVYESGTVTLTGEPVEVRVSYKPVVEAAAAAPEGEPAAEPEAAPTEQSAAGTEKTAEPDAPAASFWPVSLSDAVCKEQEEAADDEPLPPAMVRGW
jgi:hypothetical protein